MLGIKCLRENTNKQNNWQFKLLYVLICTTDVKELVTLANCAGFGWGGVNFPRARGGGTFKHQGNMQQRRIYCPETVTAVSGKNLII